MSKEAESEYECNSSENQTNFNSPSINTIIQSDQTKICENKLNTSIPNEAESEHECSSSEKQTDFNSSSTNTKLHEKEPVNSGEYTEFVRELIQRLKLATNDTEKAEILKKLKFFYPQVYARLLELKAQLDKEKKRNVSKDESEPAAKKIKTNLNEIVDEPNCAVCLDSFNEIKNKNNKILSTICGHIICSECSNKCYIKAKKSHSISCFKCRKTLKFKDIHPIFI